MTKGLENKGRFPFHYLRRLEDGSIVDVPDKTLEATLNTKDNTGGPAFEYISGFGKSKELKVEEGVVIDVPVIGDKLECPLCGFVALTEKALKLHKDKEHP